MIITVDIPPPNDAQLNWSQAAPVDWSMFRNSFPFDWVLWLTGGCWGVDSLDPMLMLLKREELEVMEM